MALFSKSTYKIRTRVGHSTNKLQPSVYLLDTGTSLNVINSKLIQDDWTHKLKSRPTQKLQSATKELITLLGAIILFVRIKNLHVKVWYGIDENLSVEILPGTIFLTGTFE